MYIYFVVKNACSLKQNKKKIQIFWKKDFIVLAVIKWMNEDNTCSVHHKCQEYPRWNLFICDCPQALKWR